MSEKRKKKKGPIRFEALLPLSFLGLLLFLYFTFFFDANLRWALSWVSSQIYGAEVNISQVKTSFKRGQLQLSNLQLTDKTKPERNVVSFQKIDVDLLWDALLRAKFVAENFNIDGIQLHSKRKKPGYILSENHPTRKLFKNVEENINNQIQDEIEGNFIGDIVKLSQGVNAQKILDQIKGDLNTDKHVKALEKNLNTKKKEWEQRLAQLPNKKQIDALIAEAKKLKLDGKNLVNSLNSVKKGKELYEKAQQYIKDYEKTKKDLGSDLGNYKNLYSELESLVKKDLNDLEKRFNIPKLDGKVISKQIFGPPFKNLMVQVKGYMDLSRKYLPPKVADKVFNKGAKKEQEKTSTIIKAPDRKKGQNYRFIIKTGYPKYWIKKGVITSQASEDFKWSGNLKGNLANITSHPQSLSVPATVELSGGFPYQKISDVLANITLDHRTAEPKETFDIKVGGLPVSKRPLIKSPDVDLILNSSLSSLSIKGTLINEKLDIISLSEFKNNDYSITTKDPIVKELLQRVLKKIPILNLRTKALGQWDNLNFDLYSNLGDELVKGLKGAFFDKIDDTKKKINQEIQKQIKEGEQQLRKEADKFGKNLLASLQKNGASLKTLEAELKKAQSQNSTKQLEKKGKELLKKLGF